MDSDRVHHIIVQQQKSPTRHYDAVQTQRQVYTASPATYLNKQKNFSNAQSAGQNSRAQTSTRMFLYNLIMLICVITNFII